MARGPIISEAEDAEPPRQFANVPPPDASGVVGQTRLIVKAVEDSVADLKIDVREIKSHRVSDLRWHIAAFSAGFVLLGGMLIAGYFKLDERIGRLEDKFQILSASNTKIETKLDDLLQRIPPLPTPVPRR